jgi:hypothetical protein
LKKWSDRGDGPVGRRLREGRPSAREEFVSAVAREVVRTSRVRVPRLRLVLAAMLTLGLLAALAAAGSVGQPAKSSVGKITDLVSVAANKEREAVANTPAQDQYGDEGCTPGYWKNHTESWTGYSTGQTVSSVFSAATGSLGSTTLLAALGGGGGSTLDAKKAILIRAAVAAVLNAANSGVSYAFDSGSVISQVNTALASNDADLIEGLKDTLDAANNAGCPLN